MTFMSATLEDSDQTATADSGALNVVQPDTNPVVSASTVDFAPRWLRTTAATTLLVAITGTVFLYLASRPLWHTDLWDHLNYGNLILRTGAVPDVEPLMTMAAGVRMVNVAWLSQLGMAVLNQKFGLTALQFLAAFLGAGSLFLVARLALFRGQSAVAGVIAGMVFLRLNFDELLVIRPQLAGLLLYCLVLARVFTPPKCSRLTLIVLPLLFAVWANLHGSFALGLFLLAVSVAGRCGDVLMRSRSLSLSVADPEALRALLLLQLCAAAVLLNPSGLAVYTEIFSVAQNPNVESMFEWSPLTLRAANGQWYAFAILLSAFALKITPRRIRCGEVLALVGTGLLAAWSARMLNWFAPVAGVVIGVHLTAGLRGLRTAVRVRTPSEPAVMWSIASVGLLWIVVAITPFGKQVLRGTTPNDSRLLSNQTPVRTVEFLNGMENIPRGIAFVPAEWSGYVMNRGPQALRPLVNLHVHLMPEEVWKDYLRLIRGPSDWSSIMDEYGMNVAIVSKTEQPALVRKIRDSADWKAEYEDRQGVVFVRRRPV
jgi:hypothetical protein